jgi:O-antigen ligase
VSAPVATLGDALGLGPRWARLLVVVGLVGVAVLVAVVTRLGMLPMALAFALVTLVILGSLRWPLLALAVFVALIPIEEIVVIDGLGTVSKFAGILFAVTYGVPRIGHLAYRAMPFAGWAFIVWACLSLGWSLDPNTAWAHIPTLMQLFIIAILVADVVVQRPSLVRPIMWVYSVSASATALVGIQTFLGQGPVAAARATLLQNQDPAQFAALLVPALVFGLYEALNADQRLLPRVLGGAVALVTTMGVVVSGTRGAWVSVAVVILVFVLPRLPRRRQIAAIGTILLIGIVTLQVPGVSNLITQRADNAVSSGGAGRTDIWAVGITIYGSAPVLGVGFANFPIAYTQDAVRASDVRTWDYLQQLGPHNLVIGTLIELGPIGLFILAWFVLPLILRRGWGPDAQMVQAALASLFILALFLDVLSNRKQVWLIIGLAAGLAFVRRRMETTLPEGDPATSEADTIGSRGRGVGLHTPEVVTARERPA